MGKSALAVVALLLTGCTIGQRYHVPNETQERSTLKFVYSGKYKGNSYLPHVAAFYHDDKPSMCSAAPEGGHRLAVFSRGNPLVAEINTNGLPIAAGRPFRIRAAHIPVRPEDGCIRVVSFVPRAGSNYEVAFIQTGPNACSLKLSETQSDRGVAEKLPLGGVVEESCIK
jgi:hypothetical protein